MQLDSQYQYALVIQGELMESKIVRYIGESNNGLWLKFEYKDEIIMCLKEKFPTYEFVTDPNADMKINIITFCKI